MLRCLDTILQHLLRRTYITESGMSGIWTYEKWSNGTVKCWGTSAVPDSGTSFRTATVALPFPFADTTYIVTQALTSSGLQVLGFGVSTGGGSVYKGASSFGYFLEVSSAATTNIRIDWFVIGKWK